MVSYWFGGALGLSKESSIPPVVVGMTVVAMGTSAPELMVSTFSALSGYPGIAIGNVIGSNIANVLLVIGLPVMIYPISCGQKGLARQTSLMVAVSLMFYCYVCVRADYVPGGDFTGHASGDLPDGRDKRDRTYSVG